MFMEIFGYLCLDVRTFSEYFSTGPLWTRVSTLVLVLCGHE
jgi:hypothetical protein